MFKKLFFLGMVLVITGCASGIQKIPNEVGISTFVLESVDVNLIMDDSTAVEGVVFASQNQLQEQFQRSIIKYLKENTLLADEESSEVGKLKITIDYKRNFNYGGESLNKPEVSHVVDVYKEDESILTFSESGYTTKYAYFEDAAVNLQIAAYTWDDKDEPRDVDLVSSLIVEDILKRLN